MLDHPLYKRRPDVWARHDPRELPRNHRPPCIYHLAARDETQPAGQGDLARDQQVALVEAALFAADEPLSTRRLSAVTGIPSIDEVNRAVRRLHGLYERGGSAFQVEELAGGYQLLSRKEFHPWLVRLRQCSTELRLSPAARETLTIVAYRQPTMRAEIETIRGVQCGDILRVLMEKGMIRIAGRHPSLGRPVLYGTTKKFLQFFGLKSLEDLPEVKRL